MTRYKTLTLTLACTLALFAVFAAPASAHDGNAFVPFHHATAVSQHRHGGHANSTQNQPGGVCDVGDNPMIC